MAGTMPSNTRNGSSSSSWIWNCPRSLPQRLTPPLAWRLRRRLWVRIAPGSMTSTLPNSACGLAWPPSPNPWPWLKSVVVMNQPDQLEQVRAALDTVTDPEIDESVAALEFVSRVEVSDENDVSIEFRLPTYWCAPNFAFMMASDMRDAVREMDWVRSVSVKLLDHFSADLINRGVA